MTNKRLIILVILIAVVSVGCGGIPPKSSEVIRGGVLTNSEYAALSLPLMDRITGGIISVGELFVAAGDNLELTFSTSWGTDVLHAIAQIKEGCLDFGELSPSPSMSAAHKELMLGCDDLIASGELIAVFLEEPGYNETSLALLTSATEYINKGTVHITTSTALLNAID